jgi:integrase
MPVLPTFPVYKSLAINKTTVACHLHLVAFFRNRELSRFSRDELQDLLDLKASQFSFSTVDHLRWDLKAIFDLAMAEGSLQRNTALLLFTPRAATRSKWRVMTIAEVQTCFRALAPRERLIAKLAILAGMRPGEIFALTWGQISDHANIRQRVYRGILDSPKTFQSEPMTPLAMENVWCRNVSPKLKEVGLGWVNFQVICAGRVQPY